jgi:UDP-N-acetylmuramate: L-alanyl-gamma-D-glutamyl-meso-diaminopimelate ligase
MEERGHPKTLQVDEMITGKTTMHIHILGICGTFMAGIAQIAQECGHLVTGSDANVYPPMSTLLESQGIKLMSGYDPAHIDSSVDCVVVGNVIRRGNPAIEYVLNQKIPYVSGPQWLAEQVLKDKWVLAVSGTHGKTTTTSLLAWILEFAGKNPGFLVGGVPDNFGVSARISDSPYFVIEADEYDSAFFDKRSKFIHYHPKTLILNNLEYDHADIFPDLAAIMQQFHYLVRTVPGNGLIVHNEMDANLTEVLAKGCWTPVSGFGAKQSEWKVEFINADGSRFKVFYSDSLVGEAEWSLIGMHNVNNALAAIAAANHVGVKPEIAVKALSSFKNVKRRLEIKNTINEIVIYDDFAHHPTAIATTLAGLRAKVGDARIIAVLELGSYTMRSGVHQAALPDALRPADIVVCKKTQEASWDLQKVLQQCQQPVAVFDKIEEIVNYLVPKLKSKDQVVVMSNSSFDGIHDKLVSALGDIYVA